MNIHQEKNHGEYIIDQNNRKTKIIYEITHAFNKI